MTLFNSRPALRFFAQYLCIGALVMAIDFGTFALLMRIGVTLAIALTIAYVLGVTAHFTLNRFLNFRNFDRAMHEQFRTYLAIVFVSWLVTLAVTETGFRLLGFTPMFSKLCAVAINLPIGFFGHRHLTFGPGITHTARTMYARIKGRSQGHRAKDG